MSAELIHGLLSAVGLGLAAVLAVVAVRELAREFRGRSGQPYGTLVADLYGETERRAELIVSWAEATGRRIERLEKR